MKFQANFRKQSFVFCGATVYLKEMSVAQRHKLAGYINSVIKKMGDDAIILNEDMAKIYFDSCIVDENDKPFEVTIEELAELPSVEVDRLIAAVNEFNKTTSTSLEELKKS